MRSMVEGAGSETGGAVGVFWDRKRLGLAPSTAFQAVPLPRWGRN